LLDFCPLDFGGPLDFGVLGPLDFGVLDFGPHDFLLELPEPEDDDPLQFFFGLVAFFFCFV